MKRLLLFVVFACAGPVSAQTNPVSTNVYNQPVEIDGYAAKVNDRIITIAEVREAVAPLLPELYRSYEGEQLQQAVSVAYTQALNELVERALILETFEQKGGQIPDQYINDEIRRIINERFNGNEAQFEQLLAAQKTSRSDYMETVRNQMIIGMMINQEVSQRARVTPEEIQTYYDTHKEQDFFIPEKVKFSVIVLNKGETEEEQSVKLVEAQSLRQKLLDGADFAETAKASSEGSRASEGGLFPWMQPTEARKELQDVLHTLPAGQISEIIDADKQLYIVKIEARRQSAYRTFDAVRKEIREALLAMERQRLRARWIERLKADHYIRIYEN